MVVLGAGGHTTAEQLTRSTQAHCSTHLGHPLAAARTHPRFARALSLRLIRTVPSLTHPPELQSFARRCRSPSGPTASAAAPEGRSAASSGTLPLPSLARYAHSVHRLASQYPVVLPSRTRYVRYAHYAHTTRHTRAAAHTGTHTTLRSATWAVGELTLACTHILSRSLQLLLRQHTATPGMLRSHAPFAMLTTLTRQVFTRALSLRRSRAPSLTSNTHSRSHTTASTTRALTAPALLGYGIGMFALALSLGPSAQRHRSPQHYHSLARSLRSLTHSLTSYWLWAEGATKGRPRMGGTAAVWE